MVTNTYSPWGVRLGTMALWALAGASTVYWGLKLSAQAPSLPVAVAAPEPVAPDALALARLLGAGPPTPVAAPAAASRFALVGVLAGTSSGGGAALIAIDGKPARPYRVGAELEPGLVLQSLGRNQARLGPSMGGDTSVALDMPLRK
ncbi:type II secretion system protein N [Acidovorax sp. Leaf160]|uniref:type II secretion system protein N n=1 Tax=Acidovorax sp. Leaf160 TaxID=1736280 RepID=UPI0006FA97A7|nr:type II secretion system protein N [Acidovorax sp. Leaf160]KQR63282.1 general secretion pathway protein C [Acidovorax sp. Leaf160]